MIYHLFYQVYSKLMRCKHFDSTGIQTTILYNSMSRDIFLYIFMLRYSVQLHQLVKVCHYVTPQIYERVRIAIV
jgi:hypothetical protein